jgi:hypothetical protein
MVQVMAEEVIDEWFPTPLIQANPWKLLKIHTGGEKSS